MSGYTREQIAKLFLSGKVPSRPMTIRDACKDNDPKSVKALLKTTDPDQLRKALNEKFLHQRTPLHWVADKGHLELCQEMLAKGAGDSINEVDEFEHTPLLKAFNKKNKTLMQLLLDHGANIHLASPKEPLLHKAVYENDLEMVQFLLKNGANPNALDSMLRPPLFWACRNKEISMMRLLIEKGANAKMIQDEFARTFNKDQLEALSTVFRDVSTPPEPVREGKKGGLSSHNEEDDAEPSVAKRGRKSEKDSSFYCGQE